MPEGHEAVLNVLEETRRTRYKSANDMKNNTSLVDSGNDNAA